MSQDVELEPLVLTAKQAAKLLNLSEREVRKLAESCKIGHYAVGSSEGRYRFAMEHVRDYLKGQERKPKGKRSTTSATPITSAGKLKSRHVDL